MPKSTHYHVKKDTTNTDKKFRPEDEHLYAREKHEFQESEQTKKAGDELRKKTGDEEPESSTSPDENSEK
jgi:hypothetical protein